MLLMYSAHFRNHNDQISLEISSEANSTSNHSNIDNDILEEDQFCNILDFLPFAVNQYLAHPFNITNKIPQPDFTIWQPPKVC